MYDATLAETVRFPGTDGDLLEAYAARPLDPASRGGVVVIHHLPGYDRETKEFVRRFATMGYNAVCPNLYTRIAPGASRRRRRGRGTRAGRCAGRPGGRRRRGRRGVPSRAVQQQWQGRCDRALLGGPACVPDVDDTAPRRRRCLLRRL